jgi:hypothetical protein
MFVCQGAGVCGGQCVPGRRQCVGTTPQVCSTEGTWGNSTGNECLKAIGATCGGGNECMSGDCVDGVCCENACGGTCMSCRNSAHGAGEGRCRAVRSGSDPNNECNDGTCRTGTCNGSGACGVTPNGQQGSGCMAGASCNAQGAKGPDSCQNGQCNSPDRTSCRHYGCDGTRCRTSCPSGTNDTNGQCVACGRNNQPCCRSGSQCATDRQACITEGGDSRCYDCGDEAESCCTGKRCYGSTVCATNACVVCGGPFDTCCDGPTPCRQGTCNRSGEFPTCEP